jgi:hypothetical protein
MHKAGLGTSMLGRSRHCIVLGVALLALPLITTTLVAPAPARASTTPSLALAPSSGPVGTTVTATASGFDPNAAVEVSYGPAIPPFSGGSCDTDASGSCVVTFVVRPDGPAGSRTVTADQPSNGLEATSVFSETSGGGVILDPASGSPGENIDAELGGFDSGETVDVDFASSPAASCVVGPNGVCDAVVKVPNGPAGAYAVTALGQTSGLQASATFSLVPAVAINPSIGSAGATLTAAGYGFAADEAVEVTFDSSVVGSCTTDSLGECSTTFSAPSEPIGPYTVAATGTTSGLEATTTFIETGPLSLTRTRARRARS